MKTNEKLKEFLGGIKGFLQPAPTDLACLIFIGVDQKAPDVYGSQIVAYGSIAAMAGALTSMASKSEAFKDSIKLTAITIAAEDNPANGLIASTIFDLKSPENTDCDCEDCVARRKKRADAIKNDKTIN